MGPVLAIVLISVVQLCITLPVVTGDCYDDTLNNTRSYDNCDTCYQTLANALINTGDNKYQLSMTFFPTVTPPPVQVEVTYRGSSNMTNTVKWYWLGGGFYVIQPLELFAYRSLFFAPPPWHFDNVTLTLPDKCLINPNKSNERLRDLTQRVRYRI